MTAHLNASKDSIEEEHMLSSACRANLQGSNNSENCKNGQQSSRLESSTAHNLFILIKSISWLFSNTKEKTWPKGCNTRKKLMQGTKMQGERHSE